MFGGFCMGKIRKQKAEAARIYSLPADYIRQSRYTAFLQSRRTDRVMLCWYIGDETGRLAGVYQSQTEKHQIVDLYNFVGDGSFKLDETVRFVTWDQLLYRLKKTPEQYCTGYLPYFMGITNNYPGQGGKCKILKFEKVA
jgi:hypothetical protein